MCAIYHLQNPPIAWILFVLSITAITTLLFVTLNLKSSNKQDEKKVTFKLKSSNKPDKKKKRQGRRGGSHNQPTPPAPTSQTAGSHNQTTPALTSESEYGATSHLPPEESESDTPSDIPPLENVSDTHLLSSKQLILNGVKDQYFANIRKGKEKVACRNKPSMVSKLLTPAKTRNKNLPALGNNLLSFNLPCETNKTNKHGHNVQGVSTSTSISIPF